MRRLTAHDGFRTGLALVVAGLLLNPWLIGYLATSDGSIDRPEVVSAILACSVALILGGMQLWWRWVEPLSWGHPVGFWRGTAVVSLIALIVAGGYWRVATYSLGHTHTTVVASEHQHASAEQQQWADDFYQRSLAAALKHGWFDIDTAFTQGFQPDRLNHTHFPNLKYMFDDVLLDPERPEWLIYDDSPDGKVLMGFMFFTRKLEEIGPTPAGPIAQWHYHPYKTARCAVQGLWTVGDPDRNGRCAEGIPVTRTPEMFHVWFIDHPLGRFTEMKVVPDYRDRRRFDLARLHPITVHFAIGLFMIAVILDLAAVVTGRRDYHRVAWINLVLAASAAVAAAAAGMTAETMLKPTHEAHQTLDVHKLLGFASLAGILVLAAWRFALRGQFPQRGALLYIVLSLAGAGALGGAGYFGGEMVYGHGAAVRAIDEFARERYWRQVREVYRNPSAGGVQPTGAPARVPAHGNH